MIFFEFHHHIIIKLSYRSRRETLCRIRPTAEGAGVTVVQDTYQIRERTVHLMFALDKEDTLTYFF